ncbi:right-handed parallel beta-helix repeat-containing protein [Massilia sp. MB5]|uniref:chondroitinase-B domain-containing protein n=1 Tax=Massilia sp. MB5 TaxID=2919578 RepID=UPI001F0FC93D|nr:chondroitinase-B domain-containing protein [Massilia sp. MB5]UMR29340.1 right-handed parallel beta-helix repeat-containing protein [Massilia sp. MB5]
MVLAARRARVKNRSYAPWLTGLLAIMLVLAALASYGLERSGIPPRRLAPYLEQRADGHNPLIVGMGRAMAATLHALDRGEAPLPGALRLRIGAQVEEAHSAGTSPAPADAAHGAPAPSPAAGAASANGAPPAATAGTVAAGGRDVTVASADALRAAIAQALPGDRINVLPGRYRFLAGAYIAVNRPGTRAQPIVLRAARAGSVVLELALAEGFLVSAPWWTFENLQLRGICPQQDNCEHAFHITGAAEHFTARNNTILDFNSHIKINGQHGVQPDHGLLEHNTLSNTAVRQTGAPVTPIDLVAASHWTIRANLISDFIKGGGDQTSYGGFAKGAGSGNVFERNVVICEQRLRGQPGQRVGLSLGGGGTAAPYCRDRRCITEQDGGVLQANLIASCSDEGIYLNRAATSQLRHNTLLDTAGIALRFPETSADLEGNLVDGRIAVRGGALLRAQDNLDSGVTRLYLGSHPLRALFQAPLEFDLRWRGTAPRREAVPTDARTGPLAELCGAPRPAQPAYGAFEDFAACLRP